MRDLAFFHFLATAELRSYIRNFMTTSDKPLYSEFTNNAEGILGTILIDMSTTPTKFGVYVDPIFALPRSTADQARAFTAGSGPAGLSTKANMVMVVPYGPGEYHSLFSHEIGPLMAGMLFGRDTMKLNHLTYDPAAAGSGPRPSSK
jgi:hypothetical protein